MMESTFTVAMPDDIPTLLQFMREYYEFDHLSFDERVARTALERMGGDDTLGCIWLIRYAGEPVGYLVVTFGYSLEYGGRDAFVDEVYIRSTHRGKGIG